MMQRRTLIDICREQAKIICAEVRKCRRPKTGYWLYLEGGYREYHSTESQLFDRIMSPAKEAESAGEFFRAIVAQRVREVRKALAVTGYSLRLNRRTVWGGWYRLVRYADGGKVVDERDIHHTDFDELLQLLNAKGGPQWPLPN
jgi:hypothetical protein